jgi:hypothetical protein
MQGVLHQLVDDGQTGFVSTQCIADNFMYSLDLVQCFKQRGKKTSLKVGLQESI